MVIVWYKICKAYFFLLEINPVRVKWTYIQIYGWRLNWKRNSKVIY